MPLTFAHPAAAVPLARPLGRMGVLSALVIGSMAPDFVYLAPGPLSRSSSHDLAGLFRFCLPVGLATYGLFRLLLEEPLRALTPASLQRRLAHAAASRAWAHPLGVVLSILVGALTHIVWDSFTHRDGWGVRVLPALSRHLASISGYDVFPFRVLQHASTVLGTVLLCRWTIRWSRWGGVREGRPPLPLSTRARAGVIAGLLAVTVTFGVVAFARRVPDRISPGTLPPVVGHAVRSGLRALACGLLVYGVAWRLTLVRRGR